MKFPVVFIFALATVSLGSLCGQAASVELSSPRGDSKDAECPYKPAEDTRITHAITLNNRLDNCAMPSEALVQGIITINTTEEYREFLKGHCAEVPTTQQCIASVTSDSNLCLNETELVIFSINKDFLESAIRILCLNDGERLAVTLGNEMICLDPANELIFFNCLSTTVEAMGQVVKDNTAYTLRRYRAIRSFKECVEDIEQCQDSGEKALKSLINELLAEMRCFSLQGDAVSCELLEE